MLLTRSIRRKLVTALALVVLTFGMLVGVSLLGVSSYRRTVKDLELSIASAPSSEELVTIVSSLLIPFALEIPGDDAPEELRLKVIAHRSATFRSQFEEIQKEFLNFDERWSRLPETLRFNPIGEMTFHTLLDHVDLELRHIDDSLPQLDDASQHESQSQEIIRAVAALVGRIKQAHDPSHVLGDRLAAAQANYRFQYWAVIGSALLTSVILAGLLVWGNQLISSPIRRLLQGVHRVAGGDFGYRIHTETACEVSHLAHAFNKMAGRFEAEQRDKERQIEERCKQLVESARLADVGFLAAGVAHEINNPLTVVMTAAEVVQFRLAPVLDDALPKEDSAEVREYLALIISEAKRCAGITKRLLDFSRRSDEQRNLYDVTAIIQDVVGMVQHLGRYRGRQLTFTRTEPLRAWINGPEIKQVILNLVANALDATAEGGEVRIAINEWPETLEILVQDTGQGMTDSQIRRIFEPFFTTKKVGQGTGLGLSISQRIVADHGGTLDAESAGEGQGSTFRLRLPRTQAASQAA